MTLMVNGTCASELRTRFWPTRLMYSFTTGSVTSLALASTCWAYSRPSLISDSSEYQLPMPRFPILRLPIASTSFSLPSCLTLLSSGWGIGAGSCEVLSVGLSGGDCVVGGTVRGVVGAGLLEGAV